MLGKKISDPEITEIDDITWAWHFASWLEDKEEKIKLMRSFGCFVGAFSNPEAARKIQQSDNDSDHISLSEEEFDAASEYVKKQGEKQDMKNKGRKTKKKLRIRK